MANRFVSGISNINLFSRIILRIFPGKDSIQQFELPFLSQKKKIIIHIYSVEVIDQDTKVHRILKLK